MRTLQLTDQNIGEVLRLLAGVLHTGNIEFMTAGGAQVSSKSGEAGGPGAPPGGRSQADGLVLSCSSQPGGGASGPELRAAGGGADPPVHDPPGRGDLHAAHGGAGQAVAPPPKRRPSLEAEPASLSGCAVWVLQAADSRDSMAMALYSRCFTWIIRSINTRIRGPEDFKAISILDIFGFENFEVRLDLGGGVPSPRAGLTRLLPPQVNRFEQFNINYANEKLQEYFNMHIFSLEQLEYNRWVKVGSLVLWAVPGESAGVSAPQGGAGVGRHQLDGQRGVFGPDREGEDGSARATPTSLHIQVSWGKAR